jgi:4-hydroxyphenylpyruvate dioxygenase
MARSKELGIKALAAVHFYVNELDRFRRFWVDQLDFAFVAASTDEQQAQTGMRTEVYEAGRARYVVSQSVDPSSEAGRWMVRHPDGVGELIFEVDDVQTTYRVLESRGAAMVNEVASIESGGGTWSSFSIATAFGDTLFTFVQNNGFSDPVPYASRFGTPKGGSNRFRFDEIDHVTSNFLTLQPLVLWCKEVMGFEEYWGIEFHTRDYAQKVGHTGSGLRSAVMWDPHSGVKFANNEPLQPYFFKSQIYTFVEDNHGPGVQHTALTIEDIVGTVGAMRQKGVEFMPTPGTYYDMLPERLEADAIEIEEDMDILRKREILVDGEGPGKYLLQIFAKDFAQLFDNPNGGPFFLEIIQRKGDRGFGGGNFRALFESIERNQVQTGRV